MRNKILYLVMGFIAMLSLSSCDDDSTDGLTFITYYPTIELEGDATIVVQKGTDYEEPGYASFLNGEDVTADVTVSSNVDTSKSGVYSITYTTKSNTEGYNASATRTIVVLDLDDAIEGYYAVTPESYREYNGAKVNFGNSYEILVINNGDGTYSVDDLIGGWYCQRAGYGTNYAMAGDISVGDDGTLTLVDSYITGWGDSLTSLNGTFDFATSTFNFVAEYTDYPFYFNITMVKE